MKTHTYLFLGLSVALFSACSSTEYRTYEGRNTVFEGQGGTRTTVDGVDFWENGEPPRKFKIMGVIKDERPGGIIPMARLKGDIAKKARAQGGDAVLLLSSGSQLRGSIMNANAQTRFYGSTAASTGTAYSTPVYRNSASFVVIKYLE